MSENGDYGEGRPQRTASLWRRPVSGRFGSMGFREGIRQSVLIRAGCASGRGDPTNEFGSEYMEVLNDRARNHGFDVLPDHIGEVGDQTNAAQLDAFIGAGEAVAREIPAGGRL